MPSFQISDPQPKAALTQATDNGAQVFRGSVSFVVENRATANRTASVRLVAADAGDMAFLKLAGASAVNPATLSLDFSPGQVRNVEVAIAVPPSAAARSGSFKLRVAAENGEDNDAVESRPVAFDVPAATVAAEPVKPSFPWWALVAAIVLLAAIGGGLAYMFIGPRGDSFADLQKKLVGKDQAEAATVLTTSGYTPVKRIIQKDDSAPGVVVEATQDPANPKQVVLSYDPGVKGLVGKSMADATAAAQAWGVAVVPRPDPTLRTEPDIVGAASLDAGAKRLTLAFDEGVEIPNLVGANPSRIADVFLPLANRATPNFEQTIVDPNQCRDEIISQRPLKNNAPNAVSKYKTGQTFFFKVRDGTKPPIQCGFVVPPIRWQELMRSKFRDVVIPDSN